MCSCVESPVEIALHGFYTALRQGSCTVSLIGKEGRGNIISASGVLFSEVISGVLDHSSGVEHSEDHRFNLKNRQLRQ